MVKQKIILGHFRANEIAGRIQNVEISGGASQLDFLLKSQLSSKIVIANDEETDVCEFHIHIKCACLFYCAVHIHS